VESIADLAEDPRVTEDEEEEEEAPEGEEPETEPEEELEVELGLLGETEVDDLGVQAVSERAELTVASSIRERNEVAGDARGVMSPLPVEPDLGSLELLFVEPVRPLLPRLRSAAERTLPARKTRILRKETMARLV